MYKPVVGDTVRITREMQRAFHMGRPDIGQLPTNEIATVTDVINEKYFTYIHLHNENRGDFQIEVKGQETDSLEKV